MTMIYTGLTITFYVNGKPQTAHNSHPKFKAIVEACRAGNFGDAAEMIDLKAVVEKSLEGSKAELRNDEVYYNGELVSSLLARRIITMAREGFDAKPLLKFLENLMSNPSKRAVDELYGFLEASQLPITEDGHFLAYKSVRQDFTDHHTGTMDNSVGAVVEMPRNAVDEDKDRTCSAGLHFAAHDYAKNFGRSGRMVVLKINPADVVAIPSDYNNQKGRACKYTILEEVSRTDTKLVDRGFVNTEGAGVRKAYEPQAHNYRNPDIWENDGNFLTFIGEAKEFPVNRDVPYCLERKTDRKEYRGDFYFINYDVKNDNLVFARIGHDREVDRYVTVSNPKEWFIQHDLESFRN